ncbi:MAG: hypothetical protein ACREFY_00100 [Acetobacteraceae bacterium]
MTDTALALVAVLEAENAALDAMDLAGAAALLGRKQHAAEEFAASVHLPLAIPPQLSARLREAAARNRALLERGLEVQGRVLAIVASAARPATIGYGARGMAGSGGGRAVALSVRA